MTAGAPCEVCGKRTGFYRPKEEPGPTGWFCQEHAGATDILSERMKRAVGPCASCAKMTGHFISYSGYPVGWFCEEHRPDKNGELANVGAIFELFRRPDDPVPVLPVQWQKKEHPFNKLAREMVLDGRARWEQVVMQTAPSPVVQLNRAQRRAQRKKK